MHVIRLRGPWEYELPEPERSANRMPRPEAGPAPGRIELAEATWSDIAGGRRSPLRVRLTRRFGRPGGVELAERIWLVVVSAAQIASVALNARPVECDASVSGEVRFDVTPLLVERNELTVELIGPPAAGGDEPATPAAWESPLLGAVRLEIGDA